MAAQKVPKEAAQRGVERLAPARRATPPRPPQARYVVFANMHLTGCCSACNLRVAYFLTTWKRKVHDLTLANSTINWDYSRGGDGKYAKNAWKNKGLFVLGVFEMGTKIVAT